jgi:hypothetical protein
MQLWIPLYFAHQIRTSVLQISRPKANQKKEQREGETEKEKEGVNCPIISLQLTVPWGLFSW